VINLERLRRLPPRPIGTCPPWHPVDTQMAAALLRTHSKTLLRWRKSTFGPQSEPHNLYVGNHRWWLPGRLLEWWESRVLPAGERRDYAQIVADWRAENRYMCTLFDDEHLVPEALPKPRKRRKRTS